MSHCKRGFTIATNLYRHIRNICKAKKDNEHDILIDNTEVKTEYNVPNDLDKAEILKKFTDMQIEIDKLKYENKELRNNGYAKQVNNGTVNNINNIHNENNINLVVNVVPFGKEDISKIDKNDLLKVFKSGFNSTLQLTETTHFNPKYSNRVTSDEDYPEFHNVYISSMKNKYAMIYDGKDWSLVYKDELIDQLYDKKRDYIEDNMEDFLESLSKSQIDALHRWLNVDDDHAYVRKVKNNIKLMLYNKRKMIIEPDAIELKEPDDIEPNERVLRTPKHGTIIASALRPKQTDKVVIKEIREPTRRPGTKRKILHDKKNL